MFICITVMIKKLKDSENYLYEARSASYIIMEYSQKGQYF
jgi:hypothetical protein